MTRLEEIRERVEQSVEWRPQLVDRDTYAADVGYLLSLLDSINSGPGVMVTATGPIAPSTFVCFDEAATVTPEMWDKLAALNSTGKFADPEEDDDERADPSFTADRNLPPLPSESPSPHAPIAPGSQTEPH